MRTDIGGKGEEEGKGKGKSSDSDLLTSTEYIP